jgi:hypothetical protein
MAVVHVTVVAGQTVSSLALLAPLGRSFTVFAASHATGSEVRLAFSTKSGGDWGTLRRTDGSGTVHVVASTNAAAWGLFVPPVPWCRVEVVGAPSSEARSFSFLPVN